MKPLTVSVPEFCRLVGIKRTKAFELIRQNDVDAVRIGRRTLVTMVSIERLLERRTARYITNAWVERGKDSPDLLHKVKEIHGPGANLILGGCQ